MFLLSRLKMIFVALGAGLAAGLVMMYRIMRAAADAKDKKELEMRVKHMREQRKRKDELEILDDDALAERARKWVRDSESE